MGRKLNGFFHPKLADEDFIMVVDGLNFEKQPARSPEYEKLLFCKVMFQIREEQNHQDPRRLWNCSQIKLFSVRICPGFPGGAMA